MRAGRARADGARAERLASGHGTKTGQALERNMNPVVIALVLIAIPIWLALVIWVWQTDRKEQ